MKWILTTFLFVTWDCLFSWSKFTAVLSTVRWRGICAGSCKCLHSSSTRHTALWLRPICVPPVNSCIVEKKDQPLLNENGHFSELCNTWILASASMMGLNLIKREEQKIATKKNLQHFCSLHGTVFLAGPSWLQSFPPLDAGGLVQLLVSVFTPPPHVTLHFDSDQSVYPPCTALIENNNPKFKFVFLWSRISESLEKL